MDLIRSVLDEAGELRALTDAQLEAFYAQAGGDPGGAIYLGRPGQGPRGRGHAARRDQLASKPATTGWAWPPPSAPTGAAPSPAKGGKAMDAYDASCGCGCAAPR